MNGRSFIMAIAGVGAMMALSHSAVAQPSAARTSVPARTIADAIAMRNIDREVTIAGRAVVASGKLQASAFDIAIEDGTGGIRLFSRTPQIDVKEGDSVTATGAIKSYRGSTELVVSSLGLIAGPRRTIVPRELTIDPPTIALHAGQLVRVKGRVAGLGHSEGGQWLRLHDAASTSRGTLTVWIPANHGAPIDLSTVAAQDSLVVTGVVTSYQDNADDPVVWQLVPRDADDVQIDAAPRVLPPWALWATLAIALILGTVLAISRISARRQLHALRETEARYRQLLVLLPDVVVVHSRGSILFTNPAAAELLGQRTEQSLVGRSLIDFVHTDSRSAFVDDGAEPASTPPERAPRVRARMLSAEGGIVDVEVASAPCVYHGMPATVLLARDITAQLRYERDLHALALVDELTGLQNRRAFTLFAEQELARARRYGRTPVVVFADLDGLKQINDHHGHGAGDMAIRLVASALKSIFRETDIVARWSGDEFVALMIEGSEEASRVIGSRLDAAIAMQSPPNLPYVVSASVGATPLDPALPLRDAMERADAELYAQKKRHRRSKIRTTPLKVDFVLEPES
ncbi:MAG: diguanylate cyclase [bacterium]